MSNKNLQPLKGFRDFLPEDARKRNWLRAKMVSVFEQWGFEPIETPTVEPLDIFEGEIGEGENLFFKFKDPGGRDVALRYDQTVPSCRVVGQYFDQLTLPLRRYQIQSNFRAEKPQKGRYREFTQADVDIFGLASPLADAECTALSINLYLQLGFKQPVAIINNRDLLRDIPYKAIAAMDKLRKIGKEEVIKEMIKNGIPLTKATKYFEQVNNLKPDNKLKIIFDYLDSMGYQNNYRFDPSLMRSFSYSEGPIWEMIIEGYSTSSFSGSVGGGERYDSMVKRITGRDIPATGIAFGFDRTLEALEECNLLPIINTTSQLLVTVFSEELFSKSLALRDYLLQNTEINSELWLDPSTKLDKQIKYADKKGIPFVAIIGPNEAEKGLVTLKNLKTRDQKTIKQWDLAKELQDIPICHSRSNRESI